MIDNIIEERWREFYLPYTFGELHSPQLNKVANRIKLKDKKPEDNSQLPIGSESSGFDNPLEEELYIKQHKYTTEEN